MLFKGWQVSQQDSLGNWGWIGEPGVKVTCFAVLNKFQFWSQKRDKQQETGEKTKEKLVNGRQETHDLFETLTLMLRFWAGVLSRRTSRWRKPAFQPFSYGLQSPGRHRSKETKYVQNSGPIFPFRLCVTFSFSDRFSLRFPLCSWSPPRSKYVLLFLRHFYFSSADWIFSYSKYFPSSFFFSSNLVPGFP